MNAMGRKHPDVSGFCRCFCIANLAMVMALLMMCFGIDRSLALVICRTHFVNRLLTQQNVLLVCEAYVKCRDIEMLSI